MAGVFDETMASIGAEVTNVRDNQVEEGSFDRTVTDSQTPMTAPEQTQAAPTDSNAFEEALAKLQEATPADRSHDTPEPGGGLEH